MFVATKFEVVFQAMQPHFGVNLTTVTINTLITKKINSKFIINISERISRNPLLLY